MIPKNINEVSARWFSEILDAEIIQVQPNQIGQGVGLMGDIFRVELKYKEHSTGQPASVVVKLPSSFEENRTQGVDLGMFESEVRFYNELAQDATVGIPKVYFAEIKHGTADFVVVMEDLCHLEMVDQSTGMNVEQATAAVRVLASVHAVWWDRVHVPELEWIPSMVGPRIEFVDQMLTQIYPVFAAGFEQYLPEGGLEIYKLFVGNYLKLTTAIASRSPWTLAHQDYRVENLMFGPSGSGQVVVLDWQGIGRGPGAYDLAYILGGSMETGLRRQHETDLVAAYFECLIEHGVNKYSEEQLWEDYAHAHLLGGLATSIVTGGSMDLSNERGLQLVATMSNRHAAAALDHDGLDRLKNIVS
ncbi:MAG: oxidoreductase family protein [Candidatus Azotimanducaceae bacterium WSBS_2022_MAG_OTU7]